MIPVIILFGNYALFNLFYRESAALGKAVQREEKRNGAEERKPWQPDTAYVP